MLWGDWKQEQPNAFFHPGTWRRSGWDTESCQSNNLAFILHSIQQWEEICCTWHLEMGGCTKWVREEERQRQGGVGSSGGSWISIEAAQRRVREVGGRASRNIYTAFPVLLQNHELFLPQIRGSDDGKYREANPCMQATPWCQYLLEKIRRLQRKEVKKLEGNCRVGSKGRKPE